jgi:hypothetical protein
LAGSDVAYHLREREGIARAFLPFFRHASSIAQPKRGRIAESTTPDFKLTHYPQMVEFALSSSFRSTEKSESHPSPSDFRGGGAFY